MFSCGHDLFWRESFCRRFAFPILFYFQCILTTENLQLSCYKHDVVVSYLGARRINSLRCSFKIYTLEKKSTLILSLVDQRNGIKWTENLQTIFFHYGMNELVSFLLKKLIDPWKKYKCLYPTLFVYTILWLTIAFTFSYSYVPTIYLYKLRGFCDLCTQLWFVLRLLWTGLDTDILISLPTFLSYQFTCVHNRTSFFSISER